MYANPTGVASWDMFERMDPLNSVWQASRHKYYDFGDSLITLMRRGGRPVWYYEAPGRCVVLKPLGFYRMQGWEAFRLGIDGWAFWSLRRWAGYSNNLWKTGPGGEPEYVVIGDDGRYVTTTPRWQACRDATEDYTVFHMLREYLRSHPDAEGQAALERVHALAQEFAPQPPPITDWDPDWQDIQGIRLAAEQALQRAQAQ